VKFKVEWLDRAIRRLFELTTTSAVDEDSVLAATLQIEEILAESPYTAGESRERDTKRVLFHAPLVVSFDIRTDMQVVRIITVNLYKSGGKD
jgi:hypothetical protein